jgi:hypothetical protein
LIPPGILQIALLLYKPEYYFLTLLQLLSFVPVDGGGGGGV